MNRPSDTMSLMSSTPSGLPPSYSRHQQDELLSTTASLSLAGWRRRQVPVTRTPTHESASQLLQVLGTNDALDLTIDNGLIYPPPPSNALYHLPRLLTWSGNEIFLFRSLPALMSRGGHSVGPARDLALYTMRRTPFTHEVTLHPRREGLKTAVMRGKKRMFCCSTSWEVEVKGQVILKYAKGKWMDKDGNIVATEKEQAAARTSKYALNSCTSREVMTIVGEGLDIATKDLIVAAWCTRIWQSHGKVSLARTLMNGEGTIACMPKPTIEADVNMNSIRKSRFPEWSVIYTASGRSLRFFASSSHDQRSTSWSSKGKRISLPNTTRNNAAREIQAPSLAETFRD
jgi:hypothetical protein